MKDLSYLKAFNPKIIREARRIMKHGITVEDIDRYLSGDSVSVPSERRKSGKRIQYGKVQGNPRPFENRGKPCGGCKKKKLQAEKENK